MNLSLFKLNFFQKVNRNFYFQEIWRTPSLSELTPYQESSRLTHLGS